MSAVSIYLQPSRRVAVLFNVSYPSIFSKLPDVVVSCELARGFAAVFGMLVIAPRKW